MKFFNYTYKIFYTQSYSYILHGGMHDMFFDLLQCVKLTYEMKVKSQ